MLVYVKLIRPEKRTFDVFRAQGVGGEPFVVLFGQLPEMSKQRDNSRTMPYHDALSEKYGHTFLFGCRPRTSLIVNEPDLLADILSRSNASNYIKPVEFKATGRSS